MTKGETDTKASAETQQEEGKDTENTVGNSSTNRFIPPHKKPDAAITFPEKMMSLMNFAVEHDEETFCVAWLPDGKSFVIRNPDEFTRQVLPKYFKATKFSSFTRKLYRWGFRQVNRGIGPDDPIIFGNEFFQRDDLELMKKMRSITAATTRKQDHHQQIDIRGGLCQKRTIDGVLGSEQQHLESNKRVQLLDQIMQQNILNSLQQNHQGQGNSFGGQQQPAGISGAAMNLANVMRPNLVLGGGGGTRTMNNGGGSSGLKPFENIFSQNLNNGGGSNGLKPFENLFSQNFPSQSSTNPLLSMAFPSSIQQPPNLSSNTSSSFGGNNNRSSSNNPTNTLDIVNAAINALRYAP